MSRSSRARVAVLSMLLSAASPMASGGAEPFEAGSADEKVLIVGVREDARPFSYRGRTDASENVLEGYRGYMIEICRRVLREVVAAGPFAGFKVEGRVLRADKRFEALDKREVDLLCGPDSITAARLRTHSVSQPMFVSGLTYAYVDPTSPLFHRGRYCGSVVGVLHGTTAASVGLRRLADENVLLRFDAALEAYLALSPERESDVREMISRAFATHATTLAKAERDWRERRRLALDELVGTEASATVKALVALFDPEASEAGGGERGSRADAIDALVRPESTEAARAIVRIAERFAAREKEPAGRDEDGLVERHDAIEAAASAGELESAARMLVETYTLLMTHDEERSAFRRELADARQRQIDTGIRQRRGVLAKEIVTEECPTGFDFLPVLPYTSHDEGIPALCAGKVLYYVGDYDIIARKVEAESDCPVIIERFTRTKEVYAAFFRAGHRSASLEPVGDEACPGCRRDVLLYAAFNHALLRMMQPHIDILAFEFEREFGEQAKSADLEAFFEGFRVVSDY